MIDKPVDGAEIQIGDKRRWRCEEILSCAVGRIFFFFSIINLFVCIKIFFIDTSNTSRLNFN